MKIYKIRGALYRRAQDETSEDLVILADRLVKWLGIPTWDDHYERNIDWFYEQYYLPVEQEQERLYKQEGVDPDDFRDEIGDKAFEAQQEGETDEWRRYLRALTGVANNLGAQFGAQFDPDMATGEITVTIEGGRDAAQGMVDLINGIGLMTILNLDEFMEQEGYGSYDEMIQDHLHYLGQVSEVYGDLSPEQQFANQLA